MGQEGVMTQRRRFSAEYKREAVAMLDAPGVRMSQIAAELGIEAAFLRHYAPADPNTFDFEPLQP
jgi:transposase-like protein